MYTDCLISDLKGFHFGDCKRILGVNKSDEKIYLRGLNREYIYYIEESSRCTLIVYN